MSIILLGSIIYCVITHPLLGGMNSFYNHLDMMGSDSDHGPPIHNIRSSSTPSSDDNMPSLIDLPDLTHSNELSQIFHNIPTPEPMDFPWVPQQPSSESPENLNPSETVDKWLKDLPPAVSQNFEVRAWNVPNDVRPFLSSV